MTTIAGNQMDETQRHQLQAAIAQAFKVIAMAALRAGTALATRETVGLIEGQLEVIRQLDGTLSGNT
jgi:hypothetical protein